MRGDYVAPARAAVTLGETGRGVAYRHGLASAEHRDEVRVGAGHACVPHWGESRLADIDPGAVVAWIASLSTERKLAASTVEHVHVVMRMICDLAVRDSRMSRNPCDRVPLPRARRATQRFLTRVEVDRLAAACDYLAIERNRRHNAGKKVAAAAIEHDESGRTAIPEIDSVPCRSPIGHWSASPTRATPRLMR